MAEVTTVREPGGIVEIFAKRLRDERNRQGLSQQTLASNAGLSIGTVAELEGAKRDATLGTVEALADALSVPVDYLLG